jgi:hypothetical protein
VSLPVTVRLIVTLDTANPSVKELGDMRSMYAISQAILANSKGAALIRCGYTGNSDEYVVDLFNKDYSYSNVDELLSTEERARYGVSNIIIAPTAK